MSDLVESWEQWDEHPTFPQEANRMEDSCQVLASQLGISCSQLRAELAQQRRLGFAYDECLNNVVARHT